MIIFSHKFGQLGNRLFAFAHLIASCAANDRKIINLSFDEYARYFESTSQDLFCRYPLKTSWIKSNALRHLFFILNRVLVKILRITKVNSSSLHQIVVADLPDYQFDTGVYSHINSCEFQKILSDKSLVFLFGRFFRDFENLTRYQNLIRAFFKPNVELQKNIQNFLDKARAGADLLVGVHIRRGDYDQYRNGEYFYSLSAYSNKMRQLIQNESHSRIRFIVCSNETIDISEFAGMDVRIGPGQIVEDMYIFAGCDYIFGPPSTYTRWASFYGMLPLFQLKNLEQEIMFDNFLILNGNELYDF